MWAVPLYQAFTRGRLPDGTRSGLRDALANSGLNSRRNLHDSRNRRSPEPHACLSFEPVVVFKR